MKRNLTVLVAMAISWSICSAAMAQSDEKAVQEKISETVKVNSMQEKMMPEPEVQLSRLTNGLKLTEKQQKQIRPILDDEYAKLNKIRNNQDYSPKKIQKLVEKLRSDTKTKIDKHLTPEQRKRYALVAQEIKANKRLRVKENRKNRINSKSDTDQRPE